MEIYILNADRKREWILDEFDSFIWTERFIGYGDFQVVTVPTKTWKSRLRLNKYIGTSSSKVLMEIESILIEEDSNGIDTMTVKGRSYEKFLEQYNLYPNWLGYEKEEDIEHTYYAAGQVDNVMVQIVNDQFLLENHGNPNSVITTLEVFNSVGTSEEIEIQEKPDQSVYKVLEDLCRTHNIGMRVAYRHDNAKPIALYFYKGVDRKKVIYSSKLDNIAQESYLNDNKNFKNICLVAASNKGGRVVEVYSSGANYNTPGLSRREMWLTTDIDGTKYTEPRLTNLLMSRGKKELAKHRKKFIFDGVVTNFDAYKYKVHYNLGDTVYIMDELGNKAAKTVTEYTWAWDGEGLRSYPTFVSDE